MQRPGGLLNLNVHYHLVVPDGVFVADEDTGELSLLRLRGPSDDDLLAILERAADRIAERFADEATDRDDADEHVCSRFPARMARRRESRPMASARRTRARSTRPSRGFARCSHQIDRSERNRDIDVALTDVLDPGTPRRPRRRVRLGRCMGPMQVARCNIILGPTLVVASLLLPAAVTHADPEPIKQPIAVGYKNGTGLGYLGASVSTPLTRHLVFALQVFALQPESQWGVGLAPAIQLYLFGRPRWSPYLELGVQYVRMHFGEGFSGGGFGGYGTAGYEFNFDGGLSIQVGIGFHGRQEITAQQGIVTATQSSLFGSHYDLGLRYWF